MTTITNTTRTFFARIHTYAPNKPDDNSFDFSTDLLGEDPAVEFDNNLGIFVVPNETFLEFLAKINSFLSASYDDEVVEVEAARDILKKKGIDVTIPDATLYQVDGFEVAKITVEQEVTPC